MSRILAVVVVSLGSLVSPIALRAADELAPAAAWIPDSAILSLQIAKPKQLIERAFDPRVVAQIQALPQYKAAMAEDQRNGGPLSRIRDFQADQGMQLRTLLEKLVGGGITFAVGPQESYLLIVDSEDAGLLNAVNAFVMLLATGDAQAKGNPGRVASAKYGGVTGWTFGPDEVHAIVGSRLVISNKPEVLKAALDLRNDDSASSLAKSANYQSAMAGVKDDAVATLYANMAVLNQIPGLQEGLQQTQNPLGRLLIEPLLNAIGEATWLAGGVSLKDTELSLQVVTDGSAGDDNAADNFSIPAAGDGAMPNLEVPGQIAAVSLYRDLHKFYAAKDRLFPERTGGIIFFENMMGIFFTGRDLTEEVLAETLPDVRLVVAEQKYDETTGTPEMQIPGFALVIKLRNPEKFSLIAEEAWQKAIGLVNFTRGQQAEPGLIIDRPVHGGTKYTTASFSVADEEDKSAVDMRFNFQPALATQGDHLVFSTTDALARDLIDALREEDDSEVASLNGKHSVAVVQGDSLASVLDANRESLIKQAMVEDGKSRAEAELQWQVIIEVLKHIHRFSIDAGFEGGKSELTVEINYDLP
jgi:hypothetical protein